MKKRLLEWEGQQLDITIGKVYDVGEEFFTDDSDYKERSTTLGTWADVVETEVDMSSEEHTGGSSSNYDLKVGDTTIKCLDIIEGLDMSYNEGNILKAVWRIAAAKQGKKKKGNNMYYDSEKIVFFGERLLEEHKEDV